MTAGHKHREVHVKRDGLAHRWLTVPSLVVTRNLDWVDRSRLVFGPMRCPGGCHESGVYWRLSPLGVLHGLTGLTLVPETKEERDDRRGRRGDERPPA